MDWYPFFKIFTHFFSTSTYYDSMKVLQKISWKYRDEQFSNENSSSLCTVSFKNSVVSPRVKMRCDDEARNAKGMIHRQRKELIEFVDIRKGGTRVWILL